MDLKKLTKKERKALIIRLMKEQLVAQRGLLHYWRELTNQAAQIDTGYVAQHLVSLVTSIKGSHMRGKGDDLQDGSEVKSANFLDSLDTKGAIAPRWNFSSNSETQMLSFLKVPFIYLVSLDSTEADHIRIRIWKLNPREHMDFNRRYKKWMRIKGYPKLKNASRPAINFQLFPPRNKTLDDFARHGNGREDGFAPLQIKLEGVEGCTKILHLEADSAGELQVTTLVCE
jgi:hypothetical protein